MDQLSDEVISPLRVAKAVVAVLAADGGDDDERRVKLGTLETRRDERVVLSWREPAGDVDPIVDGVRESVVVRVVQYGRNRQ